MMEPSENHRNEQTAAIMARVSPKSKRVKAIPSPHRSKLARTLPGSSACKRTKNTS